MKKKILFAGMAAIMLICSAFVFANTQKKVTSLEELSDNMSVCYCVPAPGFDCVDRTTGNIYVNYKIVCKDVETEPVSTARLYIK